MQLARPTLTALLTLAVLASPALGRNAKPQKQSEEASSANCHAYQLSPDGNWVALPCEEEGTAKSTHHRTAPKPDDGESR